VPNGVMIKDAASIIPLETLKSRCGDRADLYSDWFRYLLLQRGLGTWLDMDVYVVGEIDGEAEYLFGKQTPTTINNAVLRLPADGAILSALLDPFQRSVIPPWLPWRSYVPMRLRQLFTGRVDLRQAPCGNNKSSCPDSARPNTRGRSLGGAGGSLLSGALAEGAVDSGS
jgi:hypothetical protein